MTRSAAPAAAASPAQAGAPAHGSVASPLRAIVLLIGSTMFFSVSDVLTKQLAATLPVGEVAWMRYLLFSLLVIPFLIRQGGPAMLRSRHYGLQVLRGFGIVGSTIAFTNALRFLPVADSTAIYFVAPILIMALSILFLGEKVGWRRWTAAMVGLMGVVIVIRPGTGAFQAAALLPILGASCWAGAAVVTRKMTGDAALTTLSYSAFVGCAVLTLLLPFSWRTPTGHELLLGLGMGLLSTIGQWLVVLAYQRGNASIIAPFSYAQLIWAGALGYLVFGSIPDGWTITGAAIIAASGLYSANRERVRAREMRARA